MFLRPRYAPWFAAWFLTWPVIAYMGGQGFSPLLVILALPALAFVRPSAGAAYAWLFLAFLAWLVAVSFWSPGDKALLEGSFGAGTLTIDSVGVRFGLTGLAGFAVLMAVQKVPVGSLSASLSTLRWTGYVQAGGVIVTALAMPQILTLIAATGQSTPPEMTQNLLRNANAFGLLLPWLATGLWVAGRQRLAAGLVAVAALAFVLTGSQSALIGVGLMLAAIGLVWRAPVQGFRILLATIAVYVVAAPVLLSWVVPRLVGLGLPLPDSFMSRIYAWQLVGQKIAEKPVLGHGLEAAQGWQDTFGDHPDWLARMVADQGLDATWEQAWAAYRIVPTHPHNMALQLWAETGAVGVGLVAACLLALAMRLREPQAWPATARYAAAGLVGVSLIFASVSYSMWNEAFWASVTIATAVIVLQARQDGEA